MAISVSYDPTENKITIAGGTESSPADFDDIVSADRAGTFKLLDGTIDADPDTFSLDNQPRPVEKLALQLQITCTPRSGATCDISGKDAWGNPISENGIDISSGSANTTNRFSEIDANGIIVNGLQNGDDFDIDQNQWGVIWDYSENDTYFLDAEIRLGDNTTPTYFKDVNKLIVFTKRLREYCGYSIYGSAFPIYIYANAHIQLGELINEETKETWKGCAITILIGTYEIFLFDGSGTNTYRRLYGCTIINSVTNCDMFVRCRANTRLWNCNLNRVFPATIDSTNLYRCTIMKGWAGFSYVSGVAPTIGDYVGHDVYIAAYVVGTSSDVIIRRLKATNAYAVWITSVNHTKDIALLDCELTNWVMRMKGEGQLGKVLRKYSVNVHIADKDGSDLSEANVVCKDKDDNEVFNVNTDVNGDIVEQEVVYQEWFQLSQGYHGESDAECFSPHKFVASKDGYETLEIDDITINEPIKWRLELLPYLAESNVKRGIQYGEDKIGTLTKELILRGQNLSGVLSKEQAMEGQLQKTDTVTGTLSKKDEVVGEMRKRKELEGKLEEETNLEGKKE